MKKLSIVLALIMALSCFGITAFAADDAAGEITTVAETTTAEKEAPTEAPGAETTTAAPTTKAPTTVAPTTKAPTTAAPTTAAVKVPVKVTVIWASVDGKEVLASQVLNYELLSGAKLTDEMILDAVKKRLDAEGKPLVDTEEYVLSKTVVAYDDIDLDGEIDDKYEFKSTTLKADGVYEFEVYATQIDDLAVFANTLGTQLAKLDWAGISKANVTLWNQIINGTKAAVDSLVKAELPELGDKNDKNDKEDAKADAAADGTEAPAETPDTGVSAVAGAAVAVLALSATTAVVLRKKED